MSLEQKKIVNSSQSGFRLVPIKVTGAGGVRTITDGNADATITAFASTGTYVITLAKASARTPHMVSFMGAASAATCTYSINADKKTITLTVTDSATPSALDCNFHLTIGFWDQSYQN